MTATAPTLRTSASGLIRRNIRRPNLGVYLGRKPLDIDSRGLQDCLNIRIRDGAIYSTGMGWTYFPRFASSPINLDNLRALFIDQYQSRAGSLTGIFCNRQDVFRYDTGSQSVLYMTPIYNTGTASMAGGAEDFTVTGAGGTAWKTAKTTTPTAGGYGNNVRPGDWISFGANDENDPAATWYQIDSVTDDNHLELFEDPGTIADGPYTIRQCLTGDNNDIFNSTIFQNSQDAGRVGDDVYYLTTGVEMLEWNGADAQMQWFYPGFLAKNLMAFRQVLVVWDVVEGSDNNIGVYKWSEIAHPRNFATNGAGEIQPSDTTRHLLQVMPLGDQAALYYEDNIILVQEVGAPVYFVFRVAIPGVGLVGAKAIMDHGDYHEFLSREAAYQFDGVTLKENMQQVFREVLTKADPNRYKMARADIDEEMGEVTWSVPLTTDGPEADEAPVTGYVQHYLEDVGPNLSDPMTIRDYPFTTRGAVSLFTSGTPLRFIDYPETDEGRFDSAAVSDLKWSDREFASTFPLQVAGDDSGNIYLLNTTNKRPTGGQKSFARFPRMALGDGEFKALVHRVEPYSSRRQGAEDYRLQITLYTYDFAEGASKAENTSEGYFDLQHGGLRYVPFRKAGRFGEIEIGTTGFMHPPLESGWWNGLNSPWDCAGYEIAVTPLGSR